MNGARAASCRRIRAIANSSKCLFQKSQLAPSADVRSGKEHEMKAVMAWTEPNHAKLS